MVVGVERLAIAGPAVGLENFGVGVGGEHHEAAAGIGPPFATREIGESGNGELGLREEFQTRRGGGGMGGGAERERYHFTG